MCLQEGQGVEGCTSVCVLRGKGMDGGTHELAHDAEVIVVVEQVDEDLIGLSRK